MQKTPKPKLQVGNVVMVTNPNRYYLILEVWAETYIVNILKEDGMDEGWSFPHKYLDDYDNEVIDNLPEDMVKLLYGEYSDI